MGKPLDNLRLLKLVKIREWAFETMEETNHVIRIYISSMKNVVCAIKFNLNWPYRRLQVVFCFCPLNSSK